MNESPVDRDELLHRLLQAQATHVRRRAARRRTASMIALACVVFGLVAVFASVERAGVDRAQIARNDLPGAHDGRGDPSSGPSVAHAVPVARIQIVRSDPTALDRFRAVAQPHHERLDDDALLTMLAELQRPTGLIRMPGRTRLSIDVTDEALNRPGGSSQETRENNGHGAA